MFDPTRIKCLSVTLSADLTRLMTFDRSGAASMPDFDGIRVERPGAENLTLSGWCAKS